VGRAGNERQFRKKHSAGIDALLADMSSEWSIMKLRNGKIEAVLHNPDQFSGGSGIMPDITPVPRPPVNADRTEWKKYLKELEDSIGVFRVNSAIGKQWQMQIAGVYSDMKAKYPHEGSWPLWQMKLLISITWMN